MLWGIHNTLKEAERLIEEEKLEEKSQERHDTRTGRESV